MDRYRYCALRFELSVDEKTLESVVKYTYIDGQKYLVPERTIIITKALGIAGSLRNGIGKINMVILRLRSQHHQKSWENNKYHKRNDNAR